MTADVVIAGGGTGGHTSPGLAVAALLRERAIACAWIGSRSGIEAQRVPPSGIPYVAISTGKLRRYWAWQNVGDLAVNVPMGMLGAVHALRALRPKVVFGTGGFVALPVMVAAAILRVPIVLHEQTAVPGLANRIGGPVRPPHRGDVSRPDRKLPRLPRGRDGQSRSGPSSARAHGRARSRAFSSIRSSRSCTSPGAPSEPIASTGSWATPWPPCSPTSRSSTSAARIPRPATASGSRRGGPRCPRALARRYTVVPYVGAELAEIYAAVALVVARAGAGTVNECCQLGVPALYVPLPGTSGDEQTENARLVERAGGAVVLPQSMLTTERLEREVQALVSDPARLKQMGEHARTLAIPDAAERIVAVLSEFCR